MMQPWFNQAKLGIFIHWGIYAIQRRGSESWPFFRGDVAYDEFMTQLGEFDPKHFDPADWAQLIADAGARYAVLTTKHHDGVALWPTKQAGLINFSVFFILETIFFDVNVFFCPMLG